MHIERAAHVDHGISHSSSTAQVGLGVALALTALATCTVGALACAGAIGTRMFVGLEIGAIVDNFVPGGITGKITEGLPTVKLGPDVKDAARAYEDSKVDCHGGHWVGQGSHVVTLGPEIRPMARRQDKTTCGGVIAEGLDTVLVGGAPSEDPARSELPNQVVWWMNLTSGVLGAANPLRAGRYVEAAGAVAGTALEAAGAQGAGSLTRGATGGLRTPGRDGGLWDWAEWAGSARGAGASGLDAANGLLGH